jgi:DNA mismatch repair protein MutS2
MLACGMYLPGRYVAMPLYQDIFADIGDEQSLESDLSSFSAHLLRIKKILQDANPRSLVLLDEIGSSTAPEEGAALAIAILESLANLGVATLATSHLGQLKLFVQDTKGMANAAMEFLGRPTYRLIMGIPGESSALAISQELGLPPAIVNRAKDYLGKDWLDLSEKIKSLNEQLAKTEALNLALTQTKTELERLKHEYETKLAQFHTFQTEEKKKTIKEMKNLLQTTRSEIENLVRQIKETKAEKSAIVKAKQYLADKLSTIKALKPAITESPSEEYKPGDYVFSRTFRQQGVVVEAKESITVAFGNIKVKLPNEDLQKVGEASPKPAIDYTTFEFNPKLVIRGMTAYEAEEALAKFLDEAVIAGVKNLVILHGKGKAVLKKMVWQKLRKDPRVEALRLAEPYEGGEGVTLVQLK